MSRLFGLELVYTTCENAASAVWGDVMDRLFLGYVKLNGKKCAQKLKDGRYLSLAQARKLDGYGGVLAPETIFIDVDDMAQSE